MAGKQRPEGPGKGSACLDDDYMMYTYKVIPCSRVSTHNWKLCHFSHVGEVAARRRHPSCHQADLCAYVSANKECPMGDKCPYAHNAFESWLHPDRYKTTLCSYAGACTRKFCFFAHSAAELRSPNKGELRLGKTSSLDTAGSVGTPNSSSSNNSSSSLMQGVQHTWGGGGGSLPHGLSPLGPAGGGAPAAAAAGLYGLPHGCNPGAAATMAAMHAAGCAYGYMAAGVQQNQHQNQHQHHLMADGGTAAAAAAAAAGLMPPSACGLSSIVVSAPGHHHHHPLGTSGMAAAAAPPLGAPGSALQAGGSVQQLWNAGAGLSKLIAVAPAGGAGTPMATDGSCHSSFLYDPASPSTPLTVGSLGSPAGSAAASPLMGGGDGDRSGSLQLALQQVLDGGGGGGHAAAQQPANGQLRQQLLQHLASMQHQQQQRQQPQQAAAADVSLDLNGGAVSWSAAMAVGGLGGEAVHPHMAVASLGSQQGLGGSPLTAVMLSAAAGLPSGAHPQLASPGGAAALWPMLQGSQQGAAYASDVQVLPGPMGFRPVGVGAQGAAAHAGLAGGRAGGGDPASAAGAAPGGVGGRDATQLQQQLNMLSFISAQPA